MIRNVLLNQESIYKTAIICDNEYLSYQDIRIKVTALQNYLPKKQGLNIAIYLPDNNNFVEAFLGVIMLGLIAFPLNTSLKKNEITSLFNQVIVDTVITSKVFDYIFEEIKTSSFPNINIIYVEDISHEEINKTPIFIDTNPNKPMLLLSTSGTTGKSKIVQLSEKNIEASTLGYIDKMDLDKDDIRYILASPLSSIYGFMILFTCLIKSLSLIILKSGFTLDSFYKTIQDHKATHYEGGVSVLQMMEQTLDRAIPYNISSLKHFGFAGSKISDQTIKKLLNFYPEATFWQGYGMTEASPLITKYTNKNHEKLNSVGTAIKGMEIAIENDNVITNAPYIEGEIIVKGANVMLGYYKNEAETLKILKNGYLHTGDIGYLDEEGYLYICGRKKNIIINRGLNVYPEEIEDCILNSQFAKDCFVYGDVDSLGNEFICADIIPINSQIRLEDIQNYCYLHLAAYKQPKKISFVDVIQKVASGKTKRRINNNNNE